MADLEHGNGESPALITRREAILRVSALLGGVALVGGSGLLTGCREKNEGGTDGPFTPDDIAFLDEVAETILPQTSTPGAKAAKTGAFMALIVTDSYSARDQKVFRDGMRKLDDASRKANNVSFVQATPSQRLALLEIVDKEQKAEGDVRKAEAIKKTQAFLAQPSPVSDASAATAITAAPPVHYFRMMKELALLGYFTSEIGCTQAQRYVEAPGRFDPCLAYHPGEKAWAPHA
jgi:glucoside 3-dehydrogenase (cytochrome c) hitch-hiker subunit